MACHPALLASPPFPPSSFFTIRTINPPNPLRIRKLRLFPLAFASTDAVNTTNSSFNGLVSEAVRILVPSARFDASKLKVVLVGRENDYSGIIPRTYILSHCDFTANLTLTISSVINFDQAMQLSGWYSKDDVVAEWKKVEGKLCLHIHCYVSGPNLKLDLAAELRYHIFSKEMPLDASVRVYFHSSSPKYNRIESWGPLKDAAEVRLESVITAICLSVL
ncbi:Magnesium dechelatase SGRL, chloroplastic [Linum perenne]